MGKDQNSSKQAKGCIMWVYSESKRKNVDKNNESKDKRKKKAYKHT